MLLKDLVGYGHSDHHLLKPWVTECVMQSEGAALPHSKRTQRALVPLAPATSEKMAPNVVGNTTVGLQAPRRGGSRVQGTVGASSGRPQVGEEGAGGCHVLIAPGTRDTSSQDPHNNWVGSAGPGEQVGAKPHSDGMVVLEAWQDGSSVSWTLASQPFFYEFFFLMDGLFIYLLRFLMWTIF